MSFLLNKKAVKNICNFTNMCLIWILIGIILFIFIDNFKYKLVEGNNDKDDDTNNGDAKKDDAKTGDAKKDGGVDERAFKKNQAEKEKLSEKKRKGSVKTATEQSGSVKKFANSSV